MYLDTDLGENAGYVRGGASSDVFLGVQTACGMLGASGNYLLGEMVSTDFEFRMRSELAAVPILANAVEAWCERQLLALKENLQLNLVIEELVTNVIVHGWHGNSEGHIRLRLSCSTLGIELELSDDGPPFNPLRYPAPNVNTSLAELPVGGLGGGVRNSV